ncbi:hypothetical protein GWK47_018916 [Chionoecetes opilio]|uniref:Uncharacterized protein n=1 Tax=Chionoecetes opilio TaxID=41210 RepID=A0A8J4XSU2_CHIOP|nr:hypothetical protein GWK47_018916 [Chionoecetes opilio]
MVQLTIIVLGGEVEANIRKPGAYHRARWMAKVIYTLKITLFREEFALTKHEKRELIRFTTFIVTTYVEPWMSAHCSTSAPATDLASSKPSPPIATRRSGRASGKVMARHMWYISEELVGLSLFDEATVVEEKRPSSAPCSSGWGRRTRLAAPTSPSTQWSSAPWRRCDDQLCRPRHRPRGRSRFPQRRSGRVVGEGRLHHGSSARPSPTGGERLCGEGRRPHQRVLRRHHAHEEQRQHLLQVVERHRALYPCAK